MKKMIIARSLAIFLLMSNVSFNQTQDIPNKNVLKMLEVSGDFFSKYEIQKDNVRSLKSTEYSKLLNIWQLDTNTKEMIQLTYDGGYNSPIISPTGNDLCFIKDSTIFSMNLKSDSVKKIVKPKFLPTYIVKWSKDGIIFFLGEDLNTIHEYNTLSGSISSRSYSSNMFNKIIEITRLNQYNGSLIYDAIYKDDWNLILKPKSSQYTKIITGDKFQDRDPSWKDEKIVLFASDRSH